MRAVTICLPYYINRGMLTKQFETIRAYPTDLRENLSVVVVDDGSPYASAWGEDIDVALQVFRITVDVRWNQDAARNIGAHHAPGSWLLLTDIDHLIPAETLRKVMSADLINTTVYRFSRVSAPTLDHYKPHPNSWLMTKKMYVRIGGYDERFAGHYGTDAEFRDRVQQKAPIEILSDVLIRVPREVIPDASTTTYTRKGDPIDVGAIKRIKAERSLKPNWKPLRLSFPYERIY